MVGAPLCWLVTILHRLRRTETVPGDVQRILIIVLSEMGALVLTRPMFDRLRQNHPSATFYLLCSEKNDAVLDLLDEVPAERVITIRSGSLTALATDGVRAVRRMRALRLDAVLDLELFARVSAILAGLSGAKIRVGFHRFTQEGLYRGDAMNRPVLYNTHQHIAQQFVTLADAIGSTDVPTAKRLVSPTPLRLPPVMLRPGELETARDGLFRRHPSIAGRRLVFLCPGAGLLPIRAWPLASFSAVAKDLIGRDYAVAIIGVAADRELAQTIQGVGQPARQRVRGAGGRLGGRLAGRHTAVCVTPRLVRRLETRSRNPYAAAASVIGSAGSAQTLRSARIPGTVCAADTASAQTL